MDAPQKCRESFSRARGRQNQRGFAARNRRPAGKLRMRRRGKNRAKPIPHRGVKDAKPIGEVRWNFDFVALRHRRGNASFRISNTLDAMSLAEYAEARMLENAAREAPRVTGKAWKDWSEQGRSPSPLIIAFKG